MEIWKDISGYEGYYQVSNMGKIRSVDRVVKCRWDSGYRCKGREIVSKPTKRGYLIVSLSRDGVNRWFSVHRLVYQTFNGVTLLQVDHINEVKTDNRLSNLQALSSNDNNIKAKRHNKTSKFPGVHLYPNGKWKAQIGINGKKISLGYFDVEEDAYKAYLKARQL